MRHVVAGAKLFVFIASTLPMMAVQWSILKLRPQAAGWLPPRAHRIYCRLLGIDVQQFGEIVDVASDDITPSVVVQFRSRQEAEAAHTRGRQFGDRLLTVNWHTQPAPAPAPVVPVGSGTAGVGGTQTTAAAEAAMKVGWGWGVPSGAVGEC